MAGVLTETKGSCVPFAGLAAPECSETLLGLEPVADATVGADIVTQHPAHVGQRQVGVHQEGMQHRQLVAPNVCQQSQ